MARSNARARPGSTRYSIVTSTGPSSGDGSSTKSDVHSEGAGRRSSGPSVGKPDDDSHGEANDEAACRRVERHRNAHHPREPAPGHAAEGYPSEDAQQVQRQRPRSDPARNRALRAGVDGRGRADPGSARGHEQRPEPERARHVRETKARRRGDEARHSEDSIRSEVSSHPRQDQRTDHGAEAHAAKQQSIALRTETELVACDQRQQRPHHARAEGEDGAARHHGVKRGRVPRIAQPRTHGAEEIFRGSRLSRRGAFHLQRTIMVPRNDTPFRRSWRPGRLAATTSPPRAGPIARARWKPMLLSEIADSSSRRGTRSGTIAWKAGPVSALPAPITNVRRSSSDGDIASAA